MLINECPPGVARLDRHADLERPGIVLESRELADVAAGVHRIQPLDAGVGVPEREDLAAFSKPTT